MKINFHSRCSFITFYSLLILHYWGIRSFHKRSLVNINMILILDNLICSISYLNFIINVFVKLNYFELKANSYMEENKITEWVQWVWAIISKDTIPNVMIPKVEILKDQNSLSKILKNHNPKYQNLKSIILEKNLKIKDIYSFI